MLSPFACGKQVNYSARNALLVEGPRRLAAWLPGWLRCDVVSTSRPRRRTPSAHDARRNFHHARQIGEVDYKLLPLTQ